MLSLEIKQVSKIANLHQFVIDELPQKYLTTIGERGIRLSSGQRQRIGIGRAAKVANKSFESNSRVDSSLCK